MANHHGRRLDGWKAIANYLDRDVRTAQRWHAQRGMPVYHVPGGSHGSVFADPDELDEWLAPAGDHSSGDPTAPSAHSHTTPAPRASQSSALPVAGMKRKPAHRRGDRPQNGLFAMVPGRGRLTLATALALATVGVVWLTWPARTRSELPPDRIELAGNSLVARSGETQTWEYRVPLLTPSDPLDARWSLRDWRFVILNRQGESAVLVSLDLVRPTSVLVRSQVLLLTAAGKLRWAFTPRMSLDFGGRRFEDGWRTESTLVTEMPSGPDVWVAAYHRTWWPSFVVDIGPDGHENLRFVNPGHVYALASIHNAAGAFVLAAGINNEYASGMLAEIQEDGPPAAAPSSADDYTCRNCPEGRPVRYFLLPRSELNRLSGDPYNRPYQVSVSTSGVDVSVLESNVPRPLGVVYHFSSSLEVQTVAVADAYAEAHRELEQEGQLDHPFADCPEHIQGMPVRVWSRGDGWRDVWARPAGHSEVPRHTTLP